MLPPQSGLRQWVLTFPFAWRRRLAQDGALLGRLTRIFVETVAGFYDKRAAKQGATGAKTGAVTVVQRTSSDLRLNPHLHAIFLDGAWHEHGGELAWLGLGHLKTSEVGEVLERVVRRMERHLRRRHLARDRGGDELALGIPLAAGIVAFLVDPEQPPAGGASVGERACAAVGESTPGLHLRQSRQRVEQEHHQVGWFSDVPAPPLTT